ncbi:MAG: FAD-dependent oxidoreductase, partial [Sphingomonadaceae bacterium]
MTKRHLAIVGSGPAGFYTAEAALQQFGDEVAITLLDRLPTPFGLIRTGVAPDHQAVKAVTARYAGIVRDPRVHFAGNVLTGQDISIAELQSLYDDVVLATGAPVDRELDVPGKDLPGVTGSTAFVGWYNGHPDYAHKAPLLAGGSAVIVGHGNVALDCARVLSRRPERLAGSDITREALEALAAARFADIHIVGRRGPVETKFSPRQVEELASLRDVHFVVDPADFPPPEDVRALSASQRMAMAALRRFGGEAGSGKRPVQLHFDFFRRVRRILGADRVEAVELVRTRVGPDGAPSDTGDIETIPASLVITAIGHVGEPVPGVPWDRDSGRFVNADGSIAPGLWCVGWARRGASGTIGSNRPDGFHIIERMAGISAPGTIERAGYTGLVDMLAARGIVPSGFSDWQVIDAAEIAAARKGAPREKVTDPDELRKLIGADVESASDP